MRCSKCGKLNAPAADPCKCTKEELQNEIGTLQLKVTNTMEERDRFQKMMWHESKLKAEAHKECGKLNVAVRAIQEALKDIP